MLWILASVFFCYCAFREIRGSLVAPPGYDAPQPITKPYLVLVVSLALLCAWPPFHTWRFQRFLSAKATELAETERAAPARVEGLECRLNSLVRVDERGDEEADAGEKLTLIDGTVAIRVE